MEREIFEVDASSPASSSTTDEHTRPMFVTHQVSKLDTLAGLAIKYNVSVGDIKRANGLLSDSALYARGTILIPTAHLPIGAELQRICAQVLTGVSRDPVLHHDSQMQPASAAVARIAAKLNVVNGNSYPADISISDAAWLAMCQCGDCGPMDPNGMCLRNMQSAEMEMTDMSSEGAYLPPASSGPTRHAEAVRRRRNQPGDDASSCTDSANSFGWGAVRHAHSAAKASSTSAFASPALAAAGGMQRAASGALDGGSDNGRLAAWFAELGKSISEGVSETVAKVKQAASQPVLVLPAGAPAGFGAAADAVLASRRRAAGAATLGRAPFEGGRGSEPGLVAGPGSGRAKRGGKDD